MMRGGEHRKAILVALLWSFSAGSGLLSAQSPTHTLLSPQPGSTINPNELFVAAVYHPEAEIIRESVVILLDSFKALRPYCRIEPHRVTVLYPVPLPPGEHTIEVFAFDKKLDRTLKSHVKFTVRGTAPPVTGGEPGVAEPDSIPPSAWDKLGIGMKGQVGLSTRMNVLTGPGIAQRQEPDEVHIFNLSGEAQTRTFSIPYRLLLTSDARQQTSQRNRFAIGFKTRNFGLYYGDHNPGIDRLVMGQQPVRGIKAEGNIPGIGLRIMALRGTGTEAREGLLGTTSDSRLPPSPDIRSDSTFLTQPGRFRREITAIGLGFGRTPRNHAFQFTVVKARDDTNSIEFGSDPKDQLAIGLQDDFNFAKRRIKVRLNLASTMTTNDISQGALSADDIKTDHDIDLPIDPKDIESILIVNGSTVPLDPRRASSAAARAEVKWTNKWHSLSGRVEQLGAAFQPFGSALLRNDRRITTVAERLFLWKRRLTLMSRYRTTLNNLSGNQLATTEYNQWMGQVSAAPGKQWPILTLSYFRVERVNRGSQTIANQTFTQETMTAGANYRVTLWGWDHQFSGIYTRNQRGDNGRIENGNTATQFSGSYSAGVGKALQFGGSFAEVQVTSPLLGNLQRNQNLGINGTLTCCEERVQLQLRGGQSRNRAGIFGGGSTRLFGTFTASYQHHPNTRLTLTMSESAFRSDGDDDRDFNHQYVLLRVTHAFDSMRR